MIVILRAPEQWFWTITGITSMMQYPNRWRGNGCKDYMYIVPIFDLYIEMDNSNQ